MVKINENYLKLPGSYLFSEVARRIAAYSAAHPRALGARPGDGGKSR